MNATAKRRIGPPCSARNHGSGNPTAVNLFGVIVALQKKTGVHLKVRAVDDAACQNR